MGVGDVDVAGRRERGWRTGIEIEGRKDRSASRWGLFGVDGDIGAIAMGYLVGSRQFADGRRCVGGCGGGCGARMRVAAFFRGRMTLVWRWVRRSGCAGFKRMT